MSTSPLHIAIDLGAGSGRALVGGPQDDGLRFAEVHRFHYAPRQVDGHLRWDISALTQGIIDGLARARDAASSLGAPIASAGVDCWGVDYALLDSAGALVEEPICYRDARTERAMDEVWAVVPRERLYARTGIQFMPFNTIFQLWAHARDGWPSGAARLLMMPDYCHHVLCGSTVCERTDASTTQLLDARTGTWDDELLAALGLPCHVMPEIVRAGSHLGSLRPDLAAATGVGPIDIVAPATHDTASAVAGTPLEPGWAYISSGTWSLVGVEHPTAVLSDTAMQAGLTNEVGAAGNIRLLTNVMGLWLLESCRREWAADGRPLELATLLDAATQRQESAGVIFPDDRRFFAPAQMVTEIRGMLRETGQPDSNDPTALTKVILDSLALRYAQVVSRIESVTGTPVPGIHVVGGGSMNRYLNQATADASARPVMAGPVEATAMGNLLVQGIASGAIESLQAGRGLVARAFPPERFVPRAPARFERLASVFAQVAHYSQTPGESGTS